MTPALVVIAVLVVIGAVVAIAAATPRLAVLGLVVAMVGATYVVEPLPGSQGLLARLAGTTLGTYLVWVALRHAPPSIPAASTGWAGTAAIAVVAFAAGWLAATSLGVTLGTGSPDGPGSGGAGAALVAGTPVARAAVGAALALTAIAVPQVALARDTLRLGVGLLLLLAAAGLVANALIGRLDSVVELAMAVMTALAGAAVAAVIAGSIQRGGDLVIRDSLRPDAAIRHRPADDAHRREAS